MENLGLIIQGVIKICLVVAVVIVAFKVGRVSLEHLIAAMGQIYASHRPLLAAPLAFAVLLGCGLAIFFVSGFLGDVGTIATSAVRYMAHNWNQ